MKDITMILYGAAIGAALILILDSEWVRQAGAVCVWIIALFLMSGSFVWAARMFISQNEKEKAKYEARYWRRK